MASTAPGSASPPKFVPPTYEDRFSAPQGDQTASLLMNAEMGGTRADGTQEETVQGGGGGGLCGCFSVRYYQPYFDVDTAQIKDRILFALFPFRKDTTFIQLLGPNPDAYGPFWVSTTLIFVIAVVSNLSSYFHFSGQEEGDRWTYDFAAVVTCATVIYGFASFIPLLLWVALKYINLPLPLIQTVAVYGYSLAAFIPFTLLNFIPTAAMPWLTELMASIASGVFLLRALGPTLIEKAPQQAAPLLGAIGAVQVALGLTIKLAFFKQ